MKFSFFILFLLFTVQSTIKVNAHQPLIRFGSSDRVLSMHPSTPLAGYGADERRLQDKVDWKFQYPYSVLFKPASGTHDRVRVKTIAIEDFSKELFLFVSFDTIGVEKKLIDDVLKAFPDMKRSHLYVTGTHTHSGPGTLSRKLALEAVAVDLYKHENYEKILSDVVTSIEEARSNLTPGNLFATRYETDDLQRNKWRRQNEKYFDTKARVLMAKDVNGACLGGILNFAVHGGALGADNLLYSSDFPGAMEQALEELCVEQNVSKEKSSPTKPIFAFFNGAEGDVGAKHGGFDGIQKGKALFKDQSREPLQAGLSPVKAQIFQSQEKRIYVGFPKYPLIILGEKEKVTKTENPEVFPYRKRAIPKADSLGKKTTAPSAWRKIDFPIFPFMNTHAILNQTRIGDLLIVSWPGEPSYQVGEKLRATLLKADPTLSDVWIFALTNDYMAYYTTREEYLEGAYDSQSSMYDWRGGDRIIQGHLQILKGEGSLEFDRRLMNSGE